MVEPVPIVSEQSVVPIVKELLSQENVAPEVEVTNRPVGTEVNIHAVTATELKVPTWTLLLWKV